MGKLFYVIGKSSTGKDTVFKNLMENPKLALRPFVMYTTRPMRGGNSREWSIILRTKRNWPV